MPPAQPPAILSKSTFTKRVAGFPQKSFDAINCKDPRLSLFNSAVAAHHSSSPTWKQGETLKPC